MSDKRGWSTVTSHAGNYDTHVDRCRRCTEPIVTHQSREKQRRRYFLCCDCTAELVHRRAAHGTRSAQTLH